ncbi:carbohydrate esterase family 1 protein [Thermothielavioides terrestris NRRL 8126]|uniref:Carbohydrate esterase family 1 protein n=1 Tax=Thermothielavioides terrestris (strain ATCC 38088 / NRRL 8126) TaxID=578455 RepID=G2RG35_THETT|nr:carbohydrate esterase family 1 protein [Thermothielavioides terrestris NRRL 8126]AEO71789.1 carbohydrate esterase family 1 protein [Thermothielavioides terrestris NRRL 8126]
MVPLTISKYSVDRECVDVMGFSSGWHDDKPAGGLVSGRARGRRGLLSVAFSRFFVKSAGVSACPAEFGVLLAAHPFPHSNPLPLALETNTRKACGLIGFSEYSRTGAASAAPASQNQTRANGLQQTPQEWGSLVRHALPGDTGQRPRMQISHVLADNLVHIACDACMRRSSNGKTCWASS